MRLKVARTPGRALWSLLTRALPWPVACAGLVGVSLLIGWLSDRPLGEDRGAAAVTLAVMVATIPFFVRRRFSCLVGGVLLVGAAGAAAAMIAGALVTAPPAMPVVLAMLCAQVFAYGARDKGGPPVELQMMRGILGGLGQGARTSQGSNVAFLLDIVAVVAFLAVVLVAKDGVLGVLTAR